MKTEAEQKNLLVNVCGAVLSTIMEAGDQGAPEGPMYLACMQHGIDLDQFERILGALQKSGLIRRSAHVCYAIHHRKEVA